MAELRQGLQGMTDAMNSLSRLRTSVKSDAESILLRAEREIRHGIVAQYWWLYAGESSQSPQMYAPPDKQVILAEVSMIGTVAGQGRQKAGKDGKPVGDGVGAAARFFGLFDVIFAGEYTMYLTSTGKANLWVDDKLVVSVSQASGAAPQEKVAIGAVQLDAGPHTLWVEHVSLQGSGKVNVEWENNARGIVRQKINAWHSAPEPGWQMQLFFLDAPVEQMPRFRGMDSDREGVVDVIEYTNWNDWNTAMMQRAMLPPTVDAQNKMKLAALQTYSASTECADASRSAVETLQSDGATCSQGVIAAINLAAGGCFGEASSRANFTCLNIPTGSCVERVGACQSLERADSLWEAKCASDEALTSLRVHHIGCGEAQRRVAWRCCKVRAPTTQDKSRQMADTGDACHGADDVAAACMGGTALESFSVTANKCPSGGFKIKAVCAEIPPTQMPIGRVAATFWGFLRVPSAQTLQVGVESAGGSRLLLDGTLVADNDGLHAQKEVRASVNVDRGNYMVTTQWFQDSGPEMLRVYALGDGNQIPLKVWHFAPPRVPDDLDKAHLAGGVLMFLGQRQSFVQQDDFIRMPSESVTIAMWVLPTGDAQGSDGVVFSYRKEGGPLLLEVRQAASLTVEVMGSVIDSGVSIVDGSWHHIAVTWRSSDGKVVMFMDGSPVIVRLDSAAGNVITNGGCLALGQHVEVEGCSTILTSEPKDLTQNVVITYSDAGSFRGSLADVVIGGTAWSGSRVRAAMMESQWTSPDSNTGAVWAVTRQQPTPKAYVQDTASSFCVQDMAPLSNWKTSCAAAWNVQWRTQQDLLRDQGSFGRVPRVMQLTGYGRAVAVRNRFTKMPTTALTACMWVKASDGGRDGVILSYGQPAAAQPLLEVSKPSELEASVLGSSVMTMLSILDDTWHHVAVTWESAAGEVHIYVDGKELLKQMDVGKGLQMPNGGCLALGTRFTSVCVLDTALVEALAAAQPESSTQLSGLVGQLTDVLIYSTVIPLGYLRACMHSESPNNIGFQWLRIALTGEQYPDVPWLPVRPAAVANMVIQACAKNGGLRGMFMSEGTYKSLSECRYRCPLLVGDYVAARTTDAAKTLEVHVRMVGVAGAQLSFANAVAVRYLTDTVTLAGDAADPFLPYYIINGAPINRFPAISRLGMRVICAEGSMPGCAHNTSKTTVIQVYSPDGSLVSFWSLWGKWSGYEVQLPINCYSENVQGLAGTMSADAHDFAVGGNRNRFADLDEKCAVSGPLATQIGGIFDGANAENGVAKWCETWSVSASGAKPILHDVTGKVTAQAPFRDVPKPIPAANAVAEAGAVPAQQTCDVLSDRPVWFETCKYAEAQWGAGVGIPALLLAKGFTQELRSVKPDPKMLRDSSGNGQDMEGRGMDLVDGAQDLVDTKRKEPLDLRPYKTFPEKLSVWAFDAAGDESVAAKGVYVSTYAYTDMYVCEFVCIYV
jgi:hypothetical protein